MIKHTRKFLKKQQLKKEIKSLEKEKLERQQLNKRTVRVEKSLQKKYEKLKEITTKNPIKNYHNGRNKKYNMDANTIYKMQAELMTGNIDEKEGPISETVKDMIKKGIFNTSKYDFEKLGIANDEQTALEVGINSFAQEVVTKITDLAIDSKYRELFNKNPYMAILKAKNAAIRTKDISAVKSHIAIDSEGKKVKDSEGKYVYELTSKAWWRGENFFKNLIKARGLENEFADKAHIKKSNIAYNLFSQKGTHTTHGTTYELSIFDGPNGEVYIVRVVSDSQTGANEGSNVIEFLSETEFDRKYGSQEWKEYSRGYNYQD